MTFDPAVGNKAAKQLPLPAESVKVQDVLSAGLLIVTVPVGETPRPVTWTPAVAELPATDGSG